MAEFVGDSDQSVRSFSHPLHARKLLQALNDSRKHTQLCDGVVIIGENSIPVQRNVLSAASPYFRGVFNFNYEDTDEAAASERKPSVLNSAEISVATFELIQDYIYTSEISLSDENIQDVLQAADMLLLSELKDLCCEYLEQCITATNCLGIQDFAARFSCLWVHHKVTKYIDDHFSEVSFSDEFLKLSVKKLKKLLSRDTLQVKTEEEVVDCIIRWYQNNPPEREHLINDLVTSCVRVSLISENYLQGSLCTELKSSCVTDMIIQKRRLATEMKIRGTAKVLIICGGEGGQDHNITSCEVVVKNSMKCFNLADTNKRNVQWIELAPMLTPRVVHGLVESGGYLYAIGGRDDNGQILSTGERYDPHNNSWTQIARMFHARVGFGLVAVDDKIYAIGGSNDMSSPITSAEVYDIYTNKWKQLPDMNLKRVWAAYAAADKKIYVMAGGIMGKLYEAVECFDTRSETWSSVAPMRERRFDARAVGTENGIYVFGGLRRLECPSAMHSAAMMKFCQTEMFSIESGQWSQVNPAGFGLCTMRDNSHVDAALYDGNFIYVIGELDVGGMCHSVRAFNPRTNTWSCTVQSKLPNQRSVQSSIVDLPLFMLHSLQWSQEKLGSSDNKQPRLETDTETTIYQQQNPLDRCAHRFSKN